jgi:hypothetical protein
MAATAYATSTRSFLFSIFRCLEGFFPRIPCAKDVKNTANAPTDLAGLSRHSRYGFQALNVAIVRPASFCFLKSFFIRHVG